MKLGDPGATGLVADIVKLEIAGAGLNARTGFVYPGADPVYVLEAEIVAVTKTGTEASNAESTLVKATDVKDGAIGEAVLIDKFEIVGVVPKVSIVEIYVGAVGTLLKSMSAPAGTTGNTNALGAVKLGSDTEVAFIVGVTGKIGKVISDGKALFKLVILDNRDCIDAYKTTRYTLSFGKNPIVVCPAAKVSDTPSPLGSLFT